jgi:hypothetical protein
MCPLCNPFTYIFYSSYYMFLSSCIRLDVADNPTQANGPKYTKCFKKPCPFYTKLNELFDGLVNKATGEHVVHLSSGKQKLAKKSNAPKMALAPATEEVPIAALGDNSEVENEVVDVDKGEGGSKGKGRAVFDDELSMVRHH